MWAIDNHTRFTVDRAFARDCDGAEVWIVAIRATFWILPDGQLAPEPAQQEVCQAPRYSGAPGQSSLRYELDLVRCKTGTDVLLHASAYAPAGVAIHETEVGFSIGPLAKRLRVIGDRVWERGATGLSPSQPQPFVTMPICYERALGGKTGEALDAPCDPANPVGVGRIARAGQPVPNCELPELPIRAPTDRIAPAGFGPIASHWWPRAKLAGTYDAAWRQERSPLLPDDFDDCYFRCAPLDQQLGGFLVGGEEVTLHNLTPDGLLRFRLPRLAFGFISSIAGGRVYHRGRLHTVILEPDQRRVILVWQSSLPCHHTLYTLKETYVFEKRRVPRRAPASPAPQPESQR